MTVRSLVLTSLLFCGYPALLLAQEPLPPYVVNQPPRPVDRPQGGTDGAYLKVGLGHWQGNIFSDQSLTQWDGNLFGSDYNLTSAKVQVEYYFDRTRLLLSGWSVGYRKDALRHMDSGHLFHAGVFRTVGFRAAALKVGGGVEWGVPSLNFDTTQFDYRDDGAIRYNHIYPSKNTDIPLIGTTKDGATYPFAEISVVQRPGRFLLEGGMRVNIVGFRFDDYEVAPNDQITYGFSSRKVLMPYLFVNVGLRLF